MKPVSKGAGTLPAGAGAAEDNLTSLYNKAALQEQLQVMENSSESFYLRDD